MARSNGPFGPPGAPLQRQPNDAFGAPAAAQWPPHPQGYDQAPQPQSTQGYHFPPPEPMPSYLASHRWGQQGGAPAYDLSYQAYSANDPGPFQQHQHQGYADADYGDDFYADEEPRRGGRWFLIAAALVGAIGVGGALAYGYKSFIAPHAGRVPLVRADPNIKVKPEKKLPVRATEEATPSAVREAEGQDDSAGEEKNTGPRSVKTIPITPGGAPPAQATTPSIPGITLYQPPQAQPAPSAAPPVQAPTQAPPKVVQPPPSTRMVTASRPPASGTDEDDPPLPPPIKRAPVQNAPVAARPLPARQAPSAGLGYVAVLSSQKTSMDALKVFADLQQKYGDVLNDKTPDVQEADLSDRGLGTMYRLVVGPPGSRNAALGVCTQLKSAGYQGCWVKEY